MTDEYGAYNRVTMNGFIYERVNHGSGQYVVGEAHTNTMEGFWSQLKRSIDGTFHSVRPKYLQRYVDEFAYRYTHRQRPEDLFHVLIPTAAKLV